MAGVVGWIGPGHAGPAAEARVLWRRERKEVRGST
jgi:hypothetical protein